MWTIRDLFNRGSVDKEALQPAPPTQTPSAEDRREAMRDAIKQRMMMVKQMSEKIQNGQ